MTELSKGNPKPVFNSLAEIMEHFSTVPFEQFKGDLDQWFYQSLRDKEKDLNIFDCEGASKLPDQLKQLIRQIYQEAEVLHNKQSTGID